MKSLFSCWRLIGGASLREKATVYLQPCVVPGIWPRKQTGNHSQDTDVWRPESGGTAGSKTSRLRKNVDREVHTKRCWAWWAGSRFHQLSPRKLCPETLAFFHIMLLRFSAPTFRDFSWLPRAASHQWTVWSSPKVSFRQWRTGAAGL